MKKVTKAQKRERIQLLVDALRGKHKKKYKQTEGALRDSKGFCCLGVACDLSKLAKWVGGAEYMGIEDVLPEDVIDYYGFEVDNPKVHDVHDESVLDEGFYREPSLVSASVLNDDSQYNFKKIADCFEFTFLLNAKEKKAMLKRLREEYKEEEHEEAD